MAHPFDPILLRVPQAMGAGELLAVPQYLRAGPQPAGRGNLGLWWERYGAGILADRKKEQTKSFEINKSVWVGALAARSDWIKEKACRSYADRLSAITLSTDPCGAVFEATLVSRLVTGTGIAHPVENGLQFHPTLGCPYIPGSSIKGAVQAFVYDWLKPADAGYRMDDGDGDPLGDDGDVEETLARIFGQPFRLDSETKSYPDGATRAGSVIFMDAIPVGSAASGSNATASIRIEPEVMTPHVGDYLVSEGLLPSDTTAPRPLIFATVAAGTTFRFNVAARAAAPRAPDEGHIGSDVALAAGWLVACLRDIGVGAKTKAGYGRFDHFRGIT